jgi:chromosome segregation ATPase
MPSENAGAIERCIERLRWSQADAGGYLTGTDSEIIAAARAELASLRDEVEAFRDAIRNREREHLEACAEADELRAEVEAVKANLREHDLYSPVPHLGDVVGDVCREVERLRKRESEASDLIRSTADTPCSAAFEALNSGVLCLSCRARAYLSRAKGGSDAS